MERPEPKLKSRGHMIVLNPNAPPTIEESLQEIRDRLDQIADEQVEIRKLVNAANQVRER